MELHAKIKGNIGEAIIAADLMKLGYSVFTEMGDNSRIDLIAAKDNDLIKIQVKSRKSNDVGAVEISNRKAGPNYRYKYQPDDVDVFAIYV